MFTSNLFILNLSYRKTAFLWDFLLIKSCRDHSCSFHIINSYLYCSIYRNTWNSTERKQSKDAKCCNCPCDTWNKFNILRKNKRIPYSFRRLGSQTKSQDWSVTLRERYSGNCFVNGFMLIAYLFVKRNTTPVRLLQTYRFIEQSLQLTKFQYLQF